MGAEPYLLGLVVPPGVNRLKGEGPRQVIIVVVSGGDGGGGA